MKVFVREVENDMNNPIFKLVLNMSEDNFFLITDAKVAKVVLDPS